MSIQIKMSATCDGCGTVLESDTPVKEADIALTRWKWRDLWKAHGVVQIERNYRPTKIYCASCADKAIS